MLMKLSSAKKKGAFVKRLQKVVCLLDSGSLALPLPRQRLVLSELVMIPPLYGCDELRFRVWASSRLHTLTFSGFTH